MRRVRLLLAAVIPAGIVPLVLASSALAAGTTSHSVYSFDLTTTNTALSPSGGMMGSPGDWISVTGSGTFDPTARTVTGGGKFVHYTSTGAVHCQGTWKATGFTSFADFGTNADGQEGGVLALVVTHYCRTMGMTMAGIPMTVTSTVNAPAGSSYLEGSTVCDFTRPTGGTVVMQPDQ
ncbi:MAG TPA: hypothetical protein VF956_12410 [Candidatus Dormibacteraeota bacterium]